MSGSGSERRGKPILTTTRLLCRPFNRLKAYIDLLRGSGRQVWVGLWAGWGSTKALVSDTNSFLFQDSGRQGCGGAGGASKRGPR